MKMTRWDDSELAFLEAHYPEHGPAWVAQQLGRGVLGCKRKAEQLKVQFDRSAERTYSRALTAIRADLAEHGKPSPLRIIAASGIARSTITKVLCEARKRGEIPPSALSAKMLEMAREAEGWGAEEDAEPSPEQVAEIEGRWAQERAQKSREPRRWAVPVVVSPGRAAR